MAKDVRHIKLVTSQAEKPRRTYAGSPIKCRKCDNRNLIETKQPTYRNGKVIKGTHSSWLCPYCMRIVWP